MRVVDEQGDPTWAAIGSPEAAEAHGLTVLGAFKKPISAQALRQALAGLPGGSDPGDANVHNVTTLSKK